MKTTNPRYAGFWPRFTAYVLDSLILGVPFVFIILPIIGELTLDMSTLKAQLDGTVSGHGYEQYFLLYSSLTKLAVFAMISWAALLALITASKWQATPGKRIMEIYVTDRDGSAPKFAQCFLRYAALPLLLLTIQTPERYYIYDNLELLTQNANATEDDFRASFITPVSDFISLLTLAVLCLWYGLIAMRPQKTAGHDILFNTRVIHGRP